MPTFRLVALAVFGCLFVALCNCASGVKEVKTVAAAADSAFETCGKSELHQAIGSDATDLITAVGSAAIHAAGDPQGELDAIADLVDADAMECAVDVAQAVIAAITASYQPPAQPMLARPASSSSLPPAAAAAAPLPALAGLDELRTYKSKLVAKRALAKQWQ